MDSVLTEKEYRLESVKKIMNETAMKNFNEMSPVKPSIPSIRFREFVITKKTNNETTYAVNSEIS